jgi:N-acyl homoserine lactone hydrolase
MLERLSFLFLAAAAVAAPAWSQAPAEVTLTRLDCGTGFNDARRFSDTFAYTDQKKPFTFSCYVIKHGDDYMVWDTGYTPGSNPNASKVTLGEQLAQLKIKPEQVKFVGISHFHADHTGQLDTVPNATLLIGQKEWDAITAPKPMQGANVAGFKHWISGGGKVEPQPVDKDVFGDGTVMILRTPGHTPGHQSLLVRLKEKGPVILIGDAAHSTTPHCAYGAGLAVEDAVVLAELLLTNEPLPAVFEKFMQRRFARCRDVVEGSCRLGELEMAHASVAEHRALGAEMARIIAQPI